MTEVSSVQAIHHHPGGDAQVKKIKAAINSMHEDLQYDYIRHLEELQ